MILILLKCMPHSEEVNQTYDIIVLLTKSMQSEQMMQILKEQEQLARILPSYV